MESVTIDIDVARTVDGPDLQSALEADGFRAMLVQDGGRACVRVVDGETSERGLRGEVLDAIDGWVYEHQAPLVVTPLDEFSYCVHPPAG